MRALKDYFFNGKGIFNGDVISKGRIYGRAIGNRAFGNEFYVDSVNGNDGWSGKYPDRPKKTFSEGYALLSENKGETLYVAPGASAYAESAVLTLSKDYVNIVGNAPFMTSGGRCRITNSYTGATTGEVVISGTGCYFENIHFQYGDSGVNTSVIGISITDGRNAFFGCSFEGPINATVGGASYRVVQIGTGVQDLEFDYCQFGQRTILATGAAGATIYLTGANVTNITLRKCMLNAYNSNTASCTIGINDTAIPDSGWMKLENCLLINHVAANIADHIRWTTAGHGTLTLENCGLTGLGTLVWCTGSWKTKVFSTGAAGAATGGVGANPT